MVNSESDALFLHRSYILRASKKLETVKSKYQDQENKRVSECVRRWCVKYHLNIVYKMKVHKEKLKNFIDKIIDKIMICGLVLGFTSLL